jgi:hypothetical protein
VSLAAPEEVVGTQRIRGELLKLGIVVSNRSIRRYRWRGPTRSPSQTRRTFLRNHAHHVWAADLFAARAVVERVIGTVRRECLAHLMIGDEQHLRCVLTEYARYHNPGAAASHARLADAGTETTPLIGPIGSRPVLNGRHTIYERAA